MFFFLRKKNKRRKCSLAAKQRRAIQKAKQTNSIDEPFRRGEKNRNDVTSAKIFGIFEILVPTA